MKLIRTGIATAAALALTALAVPSALAAPSGTTVTVTPDDLQGWGVDSPAPAYAFVAGTHTLGTGSLQFSAIPADPAASKMFVAHSADIAVADFGGVSFDYYVDPAATNKDPQQFYLNLYVQTPATGPSFYDCRYDYAATTAVDGWNTLSAAATATPTTVTAKNGATCAPTIAGLGAGSSVFLLALNAGDTSASDAGIKGGFDKVVVRGATTTTYDFEPAPVTPCRVLPTPGRVGTAGNDVVAGTAAAERISTLGGNDVVDGAGGADCILGGDGYDVLRGGAGADEISGGAGADVIDAGAGDDIITGGTGKDTISAGDGNDTVDVADGEVDSVDCGAGADTVVADRADVLRNCENVTRA